jgi:hypothetical protein
VALLGVFAVTLNWTSGRYALEVLTIRLPVFLIGRAGPDAPWEFTVLAPIGALLAAARLRRQRQAVVQRAIGDPVVVE